jgi:hypothetical protein
VHAEVRVRRREAADTNARVPRENSLESTPARGGSGRSMSAITTASVLSTSTPYRLRVTIAVGSAGSPRASISCSRSGPAG